MGDEEPSLNVQATNELPAVVLVGLEDIRGVYAARTLSGHGISVVGVTRRRDAYACRTNCCQEIFCAETRTDEFCSLLERLGPTFSTPPLIVPCTDMAALLVSRHRERLEPYYRHSLPSREAVETLSDKVSFYRFAQDNGFPIPKTRFLYSRDEVEEVAGSLSFPLVLKPPNSKSPQWLEQTKIKAFRVETAAQLIELHAIYGRLVSPLIVQEWVEGPETELYACHGFFDDNSQPLATFTSRKIRQWPPGVGQACLAEEVQDEQVRQITLDVFRRINFRGLGYMEVKRDVRSGQYLIVEPNIGRVSGRMAIAEAGGVELLYTMYCHAVGLPLPEGRIQKFVGAKWIYLRQDVQSSLFYLGSGELSLRQWWKTVQGQKTFALFSWRDPGPFVGDIIAGLKLLLDPRRRRRRTVRRTAEKPLQQASTL